MREEGALEEEEEEEGDTSERHREERWDVHDEIETPGTGFIFTQPKSRR